MGLGALAECIRQPRKAAHPHAQVEVLSPNVGRADMLWIGPSGHGTGISTNANARTVAASRGRRLAIDFDKLGEIHICPKRTFYGL